jgi:signal transduction histidine kinase
MQLPSPFDPVAARFAQTSLVAWVAAAILLGILVSILAARRLVTPLSTLAEVVERAGVTGTAMAMPTRGPREIQAIIEVFNRMQGRLSRFIEDRTRIIAALSHDLRTPGQAGSEDVLRPRAAPLRAWPCAAACLAATLLDRRARHSAE